MLTGDNRTTAEAVARQLGLDEVRADVLPAQKREVVQQLQREGRRVAMAGDGINDAPALAEAAVGIAMGTGTDVAMESAGITLVKGDLRGIVRARRLSRATMRNIRQNLFLAFVYNALGVPVAAGVLYPVVGLLISPIWASAAMTLSSVSVIANALRLRRSGAVKRYLSVARFVALMLAIALTGPSIAALACGWTCGPSPQATTDTGGSGCHEHPSQPNGPTMAAGHVCHDLATGPVLVQPSPMQTPVGRLLPRLPLSVDCADVTRGRAASRATACTAPPGVRVSASSSPRSDLRFVFGGRSG